MSPLWNRRDVLTGALAMLAVPRWGLARPRFVGEPFTLGVASGWPTPTGVSLWTRLAPAPLALDGGMTPESVPVTVEVADDEAFTAIAATQSLRAWPELGHSVHAGIEGLQPGRWYFYRFLAGDAVSPTGRTRTAPAPDAKVDRLRFAVGSCQQFEQGWYTAHRHLHDEDLDLMVFVGDYIYEMTWGEDLVRRYAGAEPVSLAEYRVRHAQHKTDADLQRLHGAVPWLMTWDDHEVDNDWAATQSEHLDPAFMTRRAAAFQAYFEHVPLPMGQVPKGADMRLYGDLPWGRLARFYLLDDRQYRSPQPCPSPARGGGSTTLDEAACEGLDDPARTMLGSEQEAWLDEALAGSGQQWNVVAQQTLVGPADADTPEGRQVWTDGWDGYPEARKRLLGSIKKRKARNPVFIGGDVHATYVSDLRLDPADRAPVATEFCGTSISSLGMTKEESDQTAADNPQFAFVDGWHRGYVAFEVTEASCTARARGVDTLRRDGGVDTLATFLVQDGRPSVTRDG